MAMTISCDCGKFRAEASGLPKATPGRLVCYCADCQDYANALGRADVLDEYGGTQVVPVYPSQFRFLQGEEHLKCHQLTRRLYRWTADCCNSPIGNTLPGLPWLGLFHSTFSAADPEQLYTLGEIKGRINGLDAKGEPPFSISPRIGIGDMFIVGPFILKGKLTGKAKGNPFFCDDGRTPVKEANLLERPAGSKAAAPHGARSNSS